MLVVCHGNTHRSALAHAVLAAKLGAARVRSRGVKPEASGPAAKKVREYAAGRGYDLSGHRAAPLTPADVRWAGVVLYMDPGNLRRMEALPGADWSGRRVECLGGYVGADKIRDPAFVPRGIRLTELLDLVVVACERFCEPKVSFEKS